MCVSSAPATSNGIAPVSAATRCTASADTNKNSGASSMKRATSQGQAMRSILGRSRVTHFIAYQLPPKVKSSKTVTLSAFVQTPTAPAPSICVSCTSI